ncbi:DUF2569 domain-containing protein [Sphingopyxis sp.]|uniref:DUF2569 domain-containing protein n=1 Tax=Sphingopyxis sp. TaxID=1908224 RepID=UPI002B46C4B2|nr:DUF2569 domain-containing protein [Sphingopyxis sp.]HJS13066.1 DUF2569 domain-containing protein [Sphingopyxis sp.]
MIANAAFERVRLKLLDRSRHFVAALEDSVRRMLLGWVIVIALLSAGRILSSSLPSGGLASALMLFVPHMLVLASPFFGYWVANCLFPRGIDFTQPEIRLARFGNWRALDPVAARRHRAFGPAGMMASLLVGMLLNLPLRTAEFMAGVPAMTAAAPPWGQMIYLAMATDIVVMNFLYTLCFFMALRRMPFFPRLLLLTWCIDVASQLAIAQYVSGAPHLPAAVAAALAPLIEGNLEKAFISIIVWMPYLMLSERVNVTYRWRQPA